MDRNSYAIQQVLGVEPRLYLKIATGWVKNRLESVKHEHLFLSNEKLY